MDPCEITRMKRQINRLKSRGRLDGKYIVLFGAAAASKEVRTCLLEHGIRPDAVIDNDERKVGRECLGIVVQKPETLLCPFHDDAAIFIYSMGFYREMILQLNKLGYRNQKHIFCLNAKCDASLPLFSYHIGRMVRGLFAYRRLIQKHSDKHPLLIAPYTGTGDIYLIGLFFREYLKRNNITQYTFVVVSGACRNVAGMFGIENIEIVPRLVVDDIINCDRALRAGWPLVILNDSWAAEYTNCLQWIRGHRGLSFDKMFRYFVFGLEDDVAYQLPPPANCGAEIKALFQRYGLKEGRTVVLSPYSNTLFELPDDVWKILVDSCKRRGYTVCTNCAGAGETPIEGTAPVFFPLGQAIEFMDTAGYFIGVRSGLCDIISASSCKKVVLYEKDGFFYHCSPFDYFSLKKMGLCEDAVELEYCSDRKDEVIEKILDMF